MYKNFTNFLGGYRCLQNELVNPILRLSTNSLMKKWMMRIQITAMILLLGLLQLSANTLAQQFTLKQNKISLENIFNEIRKQTGHNVFFEENALKTSKLVDVNFNQAPLNQVMNNLLDGTKLTYVIKENTIVIQEKPFNLVDAIKAIISAIDVTGRVLDNKGLPIPGVTVSAKGFKTVITDANGNFKFFGIPKNTEIEFSSIGYVSKTIKVQMPVNTVILEISTSKLDEVQIMAYGTTSKRLSTGNITKISGDELRTAAVSNPMIALQGQIPGMIVTQNSGVPGAKVTMQIRGRTKVDQTYGASEDALIVIDGIPMASGNTDLSVLTSALTTTGGGLSPFSTLSAGDIESIEVLKDADATAIYGSRGAKGVILVTTRKAKAGPPLINFRLRSGFSKSPDPHLLNTQQYIAMRKEAFKNDGIAMTNANAYDVLLWDTTRTKTLADELIGGTASFTDADASLSGGTKNINYAVRSTYSRETNVYPQTLPITRVSVSSNLGGNLFKERLSYDFSGSYTKNVNKTVVSDLAFSLDLPPNYKLYNDDGSLAWNEAGVKSSNPLAVLDSRYTAITNSILGTMKLSYKIIDHLNINTLLGYNQTLTDEVRNVPKTASNPLDVATNSSQFGNTNFNSTNFDANLDYKYQFGKNSIKLLAGGTLQSRKDASETILLSNYSSDALLGSYNGLTAANYIMSNSTLNSYKYLGVYGRATYDYNNTLIVNLSGRRDGSSRFGPNYKYANFAAIGTAWIFSNLDALKNSKILTFGKIRASYGTTGNDQIGDYKYLPLYSLGILSPSYENQLTLQPESFFKPNLHWEINKKLEFETDLQFLNGRIDLSLTWYRENSNDPLVQYPLPYSTGFATVTANLSGVVIQNRGWEIQFASNNIKSKNFLWSTRLNLTIPNNRLLKYPDLANSTYANTYQIGKPLDIVRTVNSKGVDPTTGLYVSTDYNGNGTFDISDMTFLFDKEPEYYGGITNMFTYKNISLSAFINFTKGYQTNWLYGKSIPNGGIKNTSIASTVDRWQYPGQIASIQKFTTVSQPFNSLSSLSYISYSNEAYSNLLSASLQTVSINYNLPIKTASKIGLKGANIFMQGQNLANFNPFSRISPLTMYSVTLRPSRTYTMGIQITL